MFRVNYYQSAFKYLKEKVNILPEMLEISKSGCGRIIDHYHIRAPVGANNRNDSDVKPFQKIIGIVSLLKNEPSTSHRSEN